MKRVFKTRAFNRWLRKTELTDTALSKAVSEMAKGLVDADLGGHVVKKRLAIPGRGKSSGARVLVGTNFTNRWFFMFGFKKSERDNIDRDELFVVQEAAKALLALKDEQIKTAIQDGALLEIQNDDQA